jgi:hypothetical protein
MTFQVGELMDPERILNGPMVVFWGQDEAVPTPAHIGGSLPISEPPKPSWRQRRKKMRPWKFMIRLQPPADEDLDEWGGRVSAALGVAWKPSRKDPTHTAIWLPGSCLATDAPTVIGECGNVLERLQGFTIVAAQIEVEALAA